MFSKFKVTLYTQNHSCEQILAYNVLTPYFSKRASYINARPVWPANTSLSLCAADNDDVQKPSLLQSSGSPNGVKSVQKDKKVCWSRLPYMIALLVIAVGVGIPLYLSLHGKHAWIVRSLNLEFIILWLCMLMNYSWIWVVCLRSWDTWEGGTIYFEMESHLLEY